MDNLDFETLTAEELKIYVDTHKEKNYELIDVRQPSEYERGHIPGARLMPLAEFESRLFTLPADRDLIFYCHNGGRSQWAASLAAESEVCQKTVYHLMFGILGWKDKILPGYPRVQVFDLDQSLTQLLETAMDLEKGAGRFYQEVVKRYPDSHIGPIMEKMAVAEKAHAKLIYHFWQKKQKHPPPFERLYQSLEGQILEGGQRFEDACRLLEEAADGQDRSAILDLAMSIEYCAFDLYRTMAERADAPEAADTFLSIAQAEKAHMRRLIRGHHNLHEK